MSGETVVARELIGWDLDDYAYRPESWDAAKQREAKRLVAQRPAFQEMSAFLAKETAALGDSLALCTSRPDLHVEMEGLDWFAGVVDLRFLLAFQRRLYLRPQTPERLHPVEQDWPSLLALSFGPQKPVACRVVPGKDTIIFESGDPNLHLRLSSDVSRPLAVHAGSPFFEVALYRGRWFLRDGYHRAYAALRAGVAQLPAVIVRAQTLEELGATQPQFFPEEILLSSSPPRVTDFLEDALTIEYERPALLKTLRVTIEETLTLATQQGEQP